MSLVDITRTIGYAGLLMLFFSFIIIVKKELYRIKEIKPITWYLSLSLFINIPAYILGHYLITNLPLLHLFTLIEFVLVSLFYCKLIE